MSSHEIVIVGGNQGGVPMVHYLLKHTVSQLEALNPKRRYHLTVISPNSSYYWKIAGPRALVSYEQTKKQTIIQPFSKIFQQYPADRWTHVPGKATGIDSAAKTVTIKLNEGGLKNVAYNSLIIATGTHYESPLWTTEYGDQALIDAQESTQSSLKTAKSVMVAGGGPVGVETAGEIIDSYPDKKVYLVSGSKRALGRLPEKVGLEAERQLKALKVELVHNKRVTSTSSVGKQTLVTFSDGSETTVDLYINAFAASPVVNYLPSAWIENGHLAVDKDTLRATGAEAENVYGLGDVHTASNKQSMAIGDSVPVIASSLALDILSGFSADEKSEFAENSQSTGLIAWLLSLFGIGGNKTKMPEQKKFKTMENTQIIPIAKSGTGTIMNYKAPGWLVYMAKGKTYLLDIADAQAGGSAFAKP